MAQHIEITDADKRAVLEAALKIAPFDGWTGKTLRRAVKQCGWPKEAEKRLFPDGALGLISYWSVTRNAQAESVLLKLPLETMKIRAKVTEGVWALLQTTESHALAMKRALSRLSLPDAHFKAPGGQAAAQLWQSADMIWRAIGDTSTDANYYSKRTILSGVIASSQLAWLNDESADKADARAFLEARIENVMQFEKTKFAVKKRTANLPNPAEVLGRLRYGGIKRRRRSFR